MPGFNLQTYKDRFLAPLRAGLHDRGSSYELADAYVFGYLNEAQAWWQDKLKVVGVRDTSTTITSGTYTYATPAGILGREITAVSLADSTDGEFKAPPLRRISWAEVLAGYNVTDPDTGTPEVWALDPQNERLIWLLPMPNYTRASGIAFDYTGQAAQLERCYNQSTITASSISVATITLSGSPGATNIVAGDEIGICPTLNSDGTTLGNDSPPVKWYEVSSYAGASTVVLTSVYGYPTVTSGSRFIVAQVSEVERSLPGKMGFGIVDKALSLYFKSQGDVKMSAFYNDEAMAKLGDVAIVEPALSIRGPRLRSQFPWMGQGMGSL